MHMVIFARCRYASHSCCKDVFATRNALTRVTSNSLRCGVHLVELANISPHWATFSDVCSVYSSFALPIGMFSTRTNVAVLSLIACRETWRRRMRYPSACRYSSGTLNSTVDEVVGISARLESVTRRSDRRFSVRTRTVTVAKSTSTLPLGLTALLV